MNSNLPPAELLEAVYVRVSTTLDIPPVIEPTILDWLEVVVRNPQNRAPVRVLLAALLAKLDRPTIDIRKPYTAIGSEDSYSGRTYDERYLTSFIQKHRLPCNATTAFLTPAFRNRNIVLTPDVNLVGRPPKVYYALLHLLASVHEGAIPADTLLAETIRQLVVLRDERQRRIAAILGDLRLLQGELALSAEAMISLIGQHLALPGSSRLPVLVVAAAYRAVGDRLGEQAVPLLSHNAADFQTHAYGDLQVTLMNDEQIITCYEMKMRRVTENDLDLAMEKIATAPHTLNNYIFITTSEIDPLVQEYARSLYDTTGGVEFVVLDCIGFLRYFLHLFYRLRVQFLDAYQELLLAEPESSVSHALKEAFLTARLAAESSSRDEA